MSSDLSHNTSGPDFIVAGATRCGTSTLYNVFSAHPDIFMPSKKELQFFYRDGDYKGGIDEYYSYFNDAEETQICGEASPPYFEKGFRLDDRNDHLFSDDEDCITRLSKHFPDTKIILSLRSPIKRVHSQFWKGVWQGRETAKTLEQAIEEEQSGVRNPKNTPLCWLYRNHYKIHIDHWLSIFPKNQVKVIIFEEWTKHPDAFYKDMSKFLGVNADGFGKVEKTNEGRSLHHPFLRPIAALWVKLTGTRTFSRKVASKQGYPELSPETACALQDIFADDIAFVKDTLGLNTERWGVTNG